MESYPKIWRMGSNFMKDLWGQEVLVQEKYDGSQFSFMKEGDTVYFRSKRQNINPDAPPNLFRPSVEHVLSKLAKLQHGVVYRCEAIAKQRHNTLTYDRVPRGNTVLYDVQYPNGTWAPPDNIEFMAEYIGIEPAAVLDRKYTLTRDEEALAHMTAFASSLGGPFMEGAVFKNADRSIMAKYVRPDFQEKHKNNFDWKRGKDLVTAVAEQYKTEARWLKLVQRVSETDKLENDPRDIGLLMKELHREFDEEVGPEAKEELWKHARKQMIKTFGRGFAEWYKSQLDSLSGVDTE